MKPVLKWCLFIYSFLLCFGVFAQPSVNSPINYHLLAPASSLSFAVNSTNQLKFYANPVTVTPFATVPVPSTINTGTTKYYVSEIVGGIESARAEIVVNVIFQITPGVIDGNQFVCDGQLPSEFKNIKAPTNTIGTVTYQWEYSDDSLNWVIIPGATNATYQSGQIKADRWFRRAEFDQNALQLVNTGFEPPLSPQINGKNWALYNEASVKGWFTSATDNLIEIWANCAVTNWCAPEGNQIAELNATQASRLYQNVYLTNGQILNWSYQHRGRTGTDVAQLNIYSSDGTTKVKTLQVASTNNLAWVVYTGSYDIDLPSGNYQFSFEAISSSTGSIGMGNLLDDIHATAGLGSNIVKLTYIPPPVTTTIEYCQGIVPITALSANGQNLLWYTDPLTGTGTATAPVPSTQTSASYYVSQTLNGCETSRSELKIVINPLPNITIADQIVCYNANATLNASSTDVGVNFSWDNGVVNNVPFLAKETKSYKVTATDLKGCVDTTSVTITVPQFNISVQSDTVCFGESVTLNATGATSISWDNGVINNVAFIPTSTQKYKATGVVSGCGNSDSVIVTVNSLPVVSANSPVICFGDSVILKGTGAKTYVWDAGITDNVKFYTATSNTYNVIGTDSNGCKNNATVTVSVTPLPVINLGKDAAYCDSTILDAGIGMTNYVWNNGANTQTITPKTSGLYWVNVTQNFCSKRDSILITIDTPHNFKLGNDTAICAGTSLKLDSKTGANAYLWNTAETTSSITINTAGQYFVKTTNGVCEKSDSINVSVTPLPIINLGNDAAYCDSIILDAGFGMTNYVWNNGANTQTITPKTSGLYWVNVTQNFCSKRDSIQITIDTPHNFKLGNDTAICAGNSLKLDSKTGANAYLWNTAETTSSITINTAGQYFVKTTNGVCVKSDTINVSVTPLPIINLGNDAAYCDSTILDAGFGMTNYVWNNGANTQTITPKTTGLYWVNVTQNLCSKRDSILITIDTPHHFKLGNDTAICAGNSLKLDSKTGANAYLWNTAETSPSININTAGQYFVKTTNGVCVKSDTINVSVTPLPIINLGKDAAYCDSTILDAGFGMTNYVWNNGANTQTITPKTSGLYWVNVTQNFCSKRDSILITIDTPHHFKLGNDTAICAGTTLKLDSKTGANAYLWNTAETTSSITINTAGQYFVKTTNGVCVKSDTINVSVTTLPVLNIGKDAAFCDSTILDAGFGMTNYVWNNGANTQTITPKTSGMYWVNVTQNFCSKRDSIQITIDNPHHFKLGNDTAICAGTTLKLDSKTGANAYLWNTAETTSSITINTAGQYFVKTTNGVCEKSDTINVSVTTLPVLNIGKDAAFCDSTILDAGFGMTNYVWNNGANTQTITPKTSGLYWVNVTQNFCSKRDSIQITIDTPHHFKLGNDTAICAGTTLKLDSKTGANAYLWNTAETTSSITINTAGQYFVKTTNGVCEKSDTINVSVTLLPNPTINETDQIICSPNSLTLTSTTTLGNKIQWKMISPSLKNISTKSEITVLESGTYVLFETDGKCSNTSSEVVLTFIKTPVANAGDDIRVKAGDNVKLKGTGKGVYQWSNSLVLDDAFIPNPSFKASEDIEFILEVSDSTSTCKSTDEVFVSVAKPVNVPNFISINDDNVNDEWILENIETHPNSSIEIFNRWGSLVWKSDNYIKPWNGTNMSNNQKLPDGTYFYVIDLHDNLFPEPINGYIQIIR